MSRSMSKTIEVRCPNCGILVAKLKGRSGHIEIPVSDVSGGELQLFRDALLDVLEEVSFQHNGSFYVALKELEQSSEKIRRMRISNKRMGFYLREMGCKSKPLNLRIDGKRSTRSYFDVTHLMNESHDENE